MIIGQAPLHFGYRFNVKTSMIKQKFKGVFVIQNKKRISQWLVRCSLSIFD